MNIRFFSELGQMGLGQMGFFWAIVLVVSAVLVGRFGWRVFVQLGQEVEAVDEKVAVNPGEPYVLLDVRTPDEFQEEHVEGAINLNLYDPQFTVKAQKQLQPNVPIYVYCRSGNRSSQAKRALEKLGFNKIHDLQTVEKTAKALDKKICKPNC
ncbi:MAG: rhodanese-like domain-containing protein [Bdellovibrionaceae bacterium]|nr:rhodanese-like domain-containing protein [Pseudobdellovibrionaceae bacterium]MDW8189915.1 rhodanese-like domain-containing protein [Pseudobdellovibrionaceae bacterium]